MLYATDAEMEALTILDEFARALGKNEIALRGDGDSELQRAVEVLRDIVDGRRREG